MDYTGSWQNMYNSLLHANNNMTLGTPALVDLNGDGRVMITMCSMRKGLLHILNLWCCTLGADWNGFDLELFFQEQPVQGSYAFSAPQPTKLYVNYGQYAFQNAYTEQPDVDAALPTRFLEGNGFGYGY